MSQPAPESAIAFKTPPWRFLDGALVLLAAIAAYAALSMAHMQLVSHTVGMEAYLGGGERLPPGVLVFGQLNKAVALMAALWLVGLKLKGAAWADVGLRPVAGRWILIGAGFGLLFFVTGVLLVKAVIAFMPGWAGLTRAPFAFDGTGAPSMLALYLALTFAITPFVEEVFFRGFMFRWMSGRYPVWAAALVSSALFGVAHILPPQAINAFVMALVLAWLYWKTGSIWPSVAAHAVNNIVGVLLGAAAAAGALPAYLTPPA